MLENAMVIGAFPYNATFEDEPDALCPQCQAHLYAGERVYDWGRQHICYACLKEEVMALDPKELTSLSGESLAYTRQQMELDHSAWDELLGIESREVEHG